MQLPHFSPALRRYAPWILALALLAISGGLIAGCATTVTRADEPGENATGLNPPSSLEVLLADAQVGRVDGHIVFLNDMHLQPGPSDTLYYAVGDNGTRLLVVSKQAKKPEADTKGSRFDLMGALHRPPTAAAMRKSWKLSKAEAAAVAEQAAYLEAVSIAPQAGERARAAPPKKAN